MIKFTINLVPKTKKNSQRIVYRNKKPIIIPSTNYIQYEKDCKWFMPKIDTITGPVNVQALYYMPTKRRVDLTNLHEALHDVLVHYKIVEDDNSNVIATTDGSKVLYDKEQPRTEVIITPIEGGGVCGYI